MAKASFARGSQSAGRFGNPLRVSIKTPNKSAGELAYNIIDVDGSVSEAVVEKIRKIDGVIMARLIPKA